MISVIIPTYNNYESLLNTIESVKNQTYHIPGNKYSFDDAKALCKAYGARLASYKELEDAYKEGAEWCSYGWSDGQMALFPTQMSTWKKLQATVLLQILL